MASRVKHVPVRPVRRSRPPGRSSSRALKLELIKRAKAFDVNRTPDPDHDDEPQQIFDHLVTKASGARRDPPLGDALEQEKRLKKRAAELPTVFDPIYKFLVSLDDDLGPYAHLHIEALGQKVLELEAQLVGMCFHVMPLSAFPVEDRRRGRPFSKHTKVINESIDFLRQRGLGINSAIQVMAHVCDAVWSATISHWKSIGRIEPFSIEPFSKAEEVHLWGFSPTSQGRIPKPQRTTNRIDLLVSRFQAAYRRRKRTASGT